MMGVSERRLGQLLRGMRQRCSASIVDGDVQSTAGIG